MAVKGRAFATQEHLGAIIQPVKAGPFPTDFPTVRWLWRSFPSLPAHLLHTHKLPRLIPGVWLLPANAAGIPGRCSVSAGGWLGCPGRRSHRFSPLIPLAGAGGGDSAPGAAAASGRERTKDGRLQRAPVEFAFPSSHSQGLQEGMKVAFVELNGRVDLKKKKKGSDFFPLIKA